MTPALPPGVLVAIETSGPVGSVAASRDGRTLAAVRLRERGAHASAMIPAVDGLLRDAGVGPSSVSGVVVGAGPGSFTGVRVAAATAKALAHAWSVPLFAVSSLAGAALSGPGVSPTAGGDGASRSGESEAPEDPPAPDAPVRYVLFDARGDRLYAACYDLGGGLATLVAPHFVHLPDLLDSDIPAGAVFCGSGARRHQIRIESRGLRVLPEPLGDPSAPGLLDALVLLGSEPVPDPGRWEPDYLRATEAERAWSR